MPAESKHTHVTHMTDCPVSRCMGAPKGTGRAAHPERAATAIPPGAERAVRSSKQSRHTCDHRLSTGCPHVCVSPLRCHVCSARLVEANRANGLSTQQHEKSRSHKKPQHWQGLGAKRPVTLRERCGTALPRQRLSTPTHWWGLSPPKNSPNHPAKSTSSAMNGGPTCHRHGRGGLWRHTQNESRPLCPDKAILGVSFTCIPAGCQSIGPNMGAVWMTLMLGAVPGSHQWIGRVRSRQRGPPQHNTATARQG